MRPDGDTSFRIRRIGIIDYIDHGLLNGKPQGFRSPIIESQPGRYVFDEITKRTHFRMFVRQGKGLVQRRFGRIVADGQHRDVVTLSSLPDKSPDAVQDTAEQGIRFPDAARQHFEQPLFAILSPLDILRLGHTVRVQEENGAGRDRGFLRLVHEIVEHADRHVSQGGQFFRRFQDEDRMVMPGITVMQNARGQIQYTQEEGHEHAGSVTLANHAVEFRDDPGRILLPVGDGPKLVEDHRHHDGGGNAFPADITDAEEQPAIPDEIVEQVTPNLLCRGQGTLDGQVLTIRDRVRKHLFLDLPGHPEFASDTGLFQVRFIKPFAVPCKAADNEEEHSQARQAHQEEPPHHRLDRRKHFLVIGDLRHDPVGFPGQRLIIDTGLLPADRVPEFDARDPVMPPDRPDNGAVGNQVRHIGHSFRGDTFFPGSSHQPPAFREHDAERRGVVLVGIQSVAEPREIDVQAAEGREPTVPIPDGIGVGGQLPDRILAIFIGIAPEISLFPEPPAEVRTLRIVMVGAGDLLYPDPAVLFIRIGFEKPPFCWIVIRNDSDASPRNKRIVPDHPPSCAEQGVGTG